MKKIILTLAVMMLAGGSVMAQADKAAAKAAAAAQKALAKEAKTKIAEAQKISEEMTAKLKENAAAMTDDEIINQSKKGAALVEEALKTGTIDEKKISEAYKLQSEFTMRINNMLLAYASNKVPFDTVLFSKNLKDMTDAIHNELKYTKEVKGETGNINYLKSRRANLANSGDYFIYAAQFENDSHRVKNALDMYDMAINYKKLYPEIANECQLRIPEEQIAYYAFHAAHEAGMYDAMDKYYEQALNFKDGAQGTQQVKIQSYLEQGDTAAWAKNMEELCLKSPKDNEDMIQILLAHYQRKGTAQMSDFADRVLAADKDVLIANYGKGFVLFATEKYDEALEYYKKCTEIKPDYYDAWYQAGLCKYKQALQLNSTISNIKNQKVAKETLEKTKGLFAEAIPFFEKARECTPDEPSKWAFELKQCYTVTGQSAKAAEMDALL